MQFKCHEISIFVFVIISFNQHNVLLSCCKLYFPLRFQRKISSNGQLDKISSNGHLDKISSNGHLDKISFNGQLDTQLISYEY